MLQKWKICICDRAMPCYTAPHRVRLIGTPMKVRCDRWSSNWMNIGNEKDKTHGTLIETCNKQTPSFNQMKWSSWLDGRHYLFNYKSNEIRRTNENVCSELFMSRKVEDEKTFWRWENKSCMVRNAKHHLK